MIWSGLTAWCRVKRGWETAGAANETKMMQGGPDYPVENEETISFGGTFRAPRAAANEGAFAVSA